MKRAHGWTVLLTGLLVAACGDRESSVVEPPEDPAVLAVFDGGQISVEDVDQAILGLPADRRRPAPGQSLDDWHRDLVRELALDRVLGSASDEWLEDPEVKLAIEEARRQIVMETYLQRNPLQVEPVEHEEAERFYRENPERFVRPARRMVYHIYLRREPGAPAAAQRETLEDLRQRISQGLSFSAMAREHSESESRHRDGLLGWVTREDVPSALADVIFGLEVGQPSPPVTTADGVHLFFVESAVEAARMSLDDVDPDIHRELQQRRNAEAQQRLSDELPLPEGSFIASREELGPLLRSGEPTATVLRIGDYELTAGRLRNLMKQAVDPNNPASQRGVAQRLVKQLELREKIFVQAGQTGLVADEHVTRRVEETGRRIVLGTQRQRGLRAMLDQEPERLRRYYEDNQGRFMSPLELRLRSVTVEAGDRPQETMRQLEEEESGALSAEARLVAVAERAGVAVEDHGWTSLPEIAAINPRLAQLAGGLAAGTLSPPLSSEGTISLFEVRERREPEPQPFAAVLEDVKGRFLADHGQEMYRQWSTDRLAEHGFVLFPDRLAALPAGLAGDAP